MASKTKWILLALVLGILPFTVLRTQYNFRLANLALIYIIVVCGLHFITGLVGQISYAQSTFYGIGAYTSALLTVRLGLPFFAGLICAIIVPTIFALIIGYATLKLEGQYMVLATLGFCMAAMLVLLNFKELTFGADGVRNIPKPNFFGLVITSDRQIYFFTLAIAAIMVLIAYRIEHSRLGRSMLAIKANKLVADVMGVSVTKVKMIAFVLSGIYGGIGGVLLAHYQGYIEPLSFGLPESIKQLTMLFVGGLGSLPGAIVGAIVLTLLPEALRKIGDYYLAIYALLCMLSIVFMPSGIWGFIGHLFGKKPLKKAGAMNLLQFIRRE